ncbi:MAG: hypothetical protein V1777_03915 [Candidatus Micrarchaeota archaeon]
MKKEQLDSGGKKITVFSSHAKKPLAAVVYLHGIRGTPKELSMMKKDLEKKCDVCFFDFDYKHIKKILPILKKFLKQKPGGIPLVIAGLSIGGACAIILGKQCDADLVVPINSFYSRAMLFKEKNLGKCDFDLKPAKYLKDIKRMEIICSKNDEKIPNRHSILLFDEFRGKKEIHILENTEHACKEKTAQRKIAEIIIGSCRALRR